MESEKVSDEAAWKAAIDVTKFTNFSMKTASKRTEAAKTTQDALTYLYTGDKAYYSDVETDAEGKTNRDDVYLAKSGNDYSVYGISYENGEKVYEGAYDKNNTNQYEYMMTGAVGTSFLSQLSQIPFSKISYSEEKKGYVYAEEGQGEAVLKVVNGLFAGYVSESTFTSGEETVVMEMSAVYYNIGTTQITLPEKMNKPEDDAGESAEITAEVFFTELKKREDASIAAKKWGTVNVAGTIVKDGVSVNVNQTNLAIRHEQEGSSVSVSYDANSTVGIAVFHYTALKNGIPSSATQKYEKDGANLKSTWIVTMGNQTQTIKVTYDADGYVIDYDYDDGSRVQKLTLSGYAGEYKLSDDSGKQPGGDATPADKEITVDDFLDKIASLQEKAVAYTKVTVNTASETYENAEISDGEVICGEGDDALRLPISVEAIQELINTMKILKAEISVRVRSVDEGEIYDLMIEFSDTTIQYTFGSDGYLTSCSNIVGNEETTVASLVDYQK